MTVEALTMPADTLLGIPADRPEILLPYDEGEARLIWRHLAADWHPDRNPDPRADDVFRHLTTLRDAARERRREGVWLDQDTLRLCDRDGGVSTTPYLARAATELGQRFIGEDTFTELYAPQTRDLMETALQHLHRLRFADEAMRREMRGWLPEVTSSLVTKGGLGALTAKKQADQVLLSDLLAASGGTLNPRHVGWILNGMLHIACYLDWLGITHNAIGPETWLVSPARHSATLIAGWSYAARVGARLAALPARSAASAPSALVRAKSATPVLDRELIKLTGRELLGDPTGMGFGPDVPTAIASWLRHPPTPSALSDYRGWQEALRQSYGPPRFVEMKISARDIYPNLVEKE